MQKLITPSPCSQGTSHPQHHPPLGARESIPRHTSHPQHHPPLGVRKSIPKHTTGPGPTFNKPGSTAEKEKANSAWVREGSAGSRGAVCACTCVCTRDDDDENGWEQKELLMQRLHRHNFLSDFHLPINSSCTTSKAKDDAHTEGRAKARATSLEHPPSVLALYPLVLGY